MVSTSTESLPAENRPAPSDCLYERFRLTLGSSKSPITPTLTTTQRRRTPEGYPVGRGYLRTSKGASMRKSRIRVRA